MSFNNVTIASVKGNDHRVRFFWYMGKGKTVNIMKYFD